MALFERPASTLFAALTLAGLVSTTAAAQWVAPPTPTDAELRGLRLVSPSVAWASGMRGTVIRSVDGGRHWMRDTVAGAGALDLRAIAATSPLVAHAMSIADSSAIYRTTDGGAS